MIVGAGGGPLVVESLKAIEGYCSKMRSDSDLTKSQARNTLDEDLVFCLTVVEKNTACEPEIKKKVFDFLQSNHSRFD